MVLAMGLEVELLTLKLKPLKPTKSWASPIDMGCLCDAFALEIYVSRIWVLLQSVIDFGLPRVGLNAKHSCDVLIVMWTEFSLTKSCPLPSQMPIMCHLNFLQLAHDIHA